MADGAGPLDLWPEPDWLQAVAGDPAYEWARIQWARSAAQPGAWFDHDKAEAVIRKWPEWFRLTEDRFAGRPFRLSVWQAITVRMVIGWKKPVDVNDEVTGQPRVAYVRLYRRLKLWMARKGGKSEFLAGLALLIWAYDSVVRGPGFVFARKEKQAKIIFNKMKAMIGYSPEMADAVSVYSKSIFLKRTFSSFELLPGTDEGTHGESAYVIIGDEMHEWRSTDLADNLHQSTGARLQPFEAHASTAGQKSNHVGYGLYEESRRILDGRTHDPTTLVVIFEIDADDDPFDEANWRKANPTLGSTPTLDFLRLEAANAIGNPRAEARFRCYHCNQWVDGITRWLPLPKWDACAATKDGWERYPETLAGRKCFGGLDLSSTRDVTALVLVFPPTDDDPKWRVLCRFWVPGDTLDERVKADAAPYDRFHGMLGHNGGPALETTEGDTVDQQVMLEAVLEARQLYDLQLLAYDPWCAQKLVTDLQNDHGAAPEFFVKFRQGIPSFAEPSRHFERLVFSGLLDHGGHPVLRWMAQNVAIRFDDNLNFMPAKKRSSEKIDGIVAAVMAVGVALAGEPADDSPSISFA
jgi:phage terminase large subunit-like protein